MPLNGLALFLLVDDRHLILLLFDRFVALRPRGHGCPVAVFGQKAAPAFDPFAVEIAACDRCLNGASGFMSVGAIAKPAGMSKLLDFCKQRIDTFAGITHEKCSDAWGIDNPAAVGHGME